MILLGFTSDVDVAVVVEPELNHNRVAADGAIFDVMLRRSGRRIDGYDDLFTAMVTDVMCFVFDLGPRLPRSHECHRWRLTSLQ